jgi:hypothetical protein
MLSNILCRPKRSQNRNVFKEKTTYGMTSKKCLKPIGFVFLGQAVTTQTETTQRTKVRTQVRRPQTAVHTSSR